MPGAEENQPGADDKDKNKNNPNPDDAGGDADDVDDEGGDDAELTPEELKAQIAKLRKENAGHRTKNKALAADKALLDGKFSKLKKDLGVEDENDDPEVKVKTLQQEKDMLAVELNLSNLCLEYGIPKEKSKYFRFLMAEKFESLDEGDEISDEDIDSVVQECLATSGGGGKSGTGVNSGGNKKPNEGGKSAITVEQFAEMSLGERSVLYTKDPNNYNTLMAQASAKGLI